jgi:CO/xanthine dehydrogenase Mo-binding subunit
VNGRRVQRRQLLIGAGIGIGFGLLATLRRTRWRRETRQASDANVAIQARSDVGLPPRSLDPSLIDTFLEFDLAGNVTLYTGKVELGTGIRTALAQIVAEELDVPFDRITTVQGDTALTPDQGTTAGSKSLQVAGDTLRQVAAEARQVLLARAAIHFGVGVDALEVVDGVVRVKAEPARRVGYGELAGQPFGQEVSGTAPLKPVATYGVVGQSVPRVDLLAKVTGEAAFVHDLRLPGMLHGRVVRPHRRTAEGAGGPVESVDARGLQELANQGMEGAVTLIHQGHFVGVVAEREEVAIAAATALRVTRELTPLPEMVDEHERLLHAPAELQPLVEEGDADRALRDATLTHAASYRQSWQAHASLGPSCAVADVRADRATIWSSSQHTHGLARAIAPLLELPPDAVRLIYMEGAGCYGQNGSDDVAADAALLSQAAGKPVRVQWSREDEFAWEPKGPAMLTELRAGLDAEGRIVGWRSEVWTPTHSNRPGGDPGKLLAGQEADPPFVPQRGWRGGGNRNAPNDYAIPNQAVTVHWTSSPSLHQSSLRSLGGFHNGTANEGFMDELAHLAGADPVQFRLRHLEDPRAIAVVEEVARLSGWEAPLEPGQDGLRRGRGIAFSRYENSYAYVATVAEIAVNPETGAIRVERVCVAHDCGLVVNPDGVVNQVEGNVLQGLSRALKEEVTWDVDGVTSLTYRDYPILTFSETPRIEVSLIDRPDEPAWGAGEPAICTVAAAVSNAVFDAVGVRFRTVPYTPARVLAALEGTPMS